MEVNHSSFFMLLMEMRLLCALRQHRCMCFELPVNRGKFNILYLVNILCLSNRLEFIKYFSYMLAHLSYSSLMKGEADGIILIL